MQEIKYDERCKLLVQKVDNALTVRINPDSGGKTAVVYQYYSDGFEAEPNAMVDLTSVLEALGVRESGDSAVLTLVGENFVGGGTFDIDLEVDVDPTWKINENLPEWNTKMWSRKIVKA